MTFCKKKYVISTFTSGKICIQYTFMLEAVCAHKTSLNLPVSGHAFVCYVYQFFLRFFFIKFWKCSEGVSQQHQWYLQWGRSWVRAPIGSIKDYKIGICCFSAKNMRMSKDWLARNQDNLSEWRNMSIRGLLFQWASTIKIQLSMLV
jgi:hypothetical protein